MYKNKYRIHNIIYQFSQQLKDIMGSKLTKVIVYGSYARGDYNSSSDVDVMILVKMSDNEIKKIENQVYDLIKRRRECLTIRALFCVIQKL